MIASCAVDPSVDRVTTMDSINAKKRWLIIVAITGLMLSCAITCINAGQIAPSLHQYARHSYDGSFIVSANSLVKRFRNGEKKVFIDVRSNTDFRALHIPGAINIPVHFIKTKSHLKIFSLVLVDRGSSLHRLLPVCRDLRTQGFDVRILDGGLNAWSSCGGSLEGSLVKQIDYLNMDPAAFFEEKDYDNRIVCDISAVRSATSSHLLPDAVHLPLRTEPDEMNAMLEEFRTTQVYNEDMLLLVFNDTGNRYHRAHHALDRAGFKTTFYLEGGVDAYENYLKGLSLSWRSRHQRMVKQNACGGCE